MPPILNTSNWQLIDQRRPPPKHGILMSVDGESTGLIFELPRVIKFKAYSLSAHAIAVASSALALDAATSLG